MREDSEITDLADEIEYIQTRWEAERDKYILPLADFTAEYLHMIGYRRI